eukprot:TRINITY_DN6259_c0_g1_i1.p1 TRINITY_DN6259_c0_g1~~TRINITY_DN6259_c0_g1_i1.p1  ORF type:complete len:232 (-),score=44.94 TRINITY_DN6259_c0_g1_i1:46-741(-)
MVLAVILHALDGTSTVFYSQFYVYAPEHTQRRAAELEVVAKVADAHAFASRTRSARRRLRGTTLDLHAPANAHTPLARGAFSGGGTTGYSAVSGDDSSRSDATAAAVAAPVADDNERSHGHSDADESGMLSLTVGGSPVRVVWKTTGKLGIALVCDALDNRHLAVQWCRVMARALAEHYRSAHAMQEPAQLLVEPAAVHVLVQTMLPDGNLLFLTDTLAKQLFKTSESESR